MQDEAIELLSDKELETFLSDNQMIDFMRLISEIPKDAHLENEHLLEKYKACPDGSIEKVELQNELVINNLKLILSVAKKNVKNLNSYTLLDIVNEGVLGFITALNRFDLQNGTKLSTYAVFYIEQRIKRSIQDKDKLIRRPVHFENYLGKYKSWLTRRKAVGKELPSIQEIVDELHVSEKTAQRLLNDYKMDTLSLNYKIDDSEETELESFLGREEEAYTDVLNKICDAELLVLLKSTLSKKDYYILYERHFKEEQKTLRVIGKEMGITWQAVSLVEQRVLKNLKKIFQNEKGYRKKLMHVRDNFDVNRANVLPVTPDEICRFYFLRESLTEEERKLYRLLVFRMENYGEPEAAKMMGMDLATYRNTYDSLMFKIDYVESEACQKEFDAFKAAFISEFKSNMFTMDLDKPLPPMYQSTLKYWDNMFISEVEGMEQDLLENYSLVRKKMIKKRVDELLNSIPHLDKHTAKLIKKYFAFVQKMPMSEESVAREVAVVANGYKKDVNLPLSILYETAIKNKDEFTDAQYDFIMTHLFGVKKAAKESMTRSALQTQKSYYIEKLERLYFNIGRMSWYNFTKEKYVALREKLYSKLDSDQIHLLDLYYGVNTQPHNISQVAKLLNVDYTTARQKIRLAREAAISCYLNIKSGKDIDADIYLPYLENGPYDLNEKGRTFALLYLKEKMDYKEIGKMYGVNPRVVSNVVMDVLRQIDLYRFGIVRSEIYPPDIIREVINKIKFNLRDQEVVEYFLEHRSYVKTAQKFETTQRNVAKLMKRVYYSCRTLMLQKTEVTQNMLKKELSRYRSDSVLLENERFVLSYYYGLSSNVNSEGIRLSSKEIGECLGKSTYQVLEIKTSALESIKARHIGLDRPSLGFMDREKVIKLLDDPCLPISNKERVILSHYFEYKRYPYKSVGELAKEYGVTESSIRRIIQRAFITLFKYDLGEIDGSVSYEFHVEPHLRYFPKSDQNILIDLYRDNLSYQEIARKRDLTYHQVVGRVFKIKNSLKDILNGDNPKPFDYDYFESHVLDEDVPFYEDKEYIYKMWYLFYEEKMSVPKIIEVLHVPFEVTQVSKKISNLMCAVMKKRMGITKEKRFTYDEIREYYLKNHISMRPLHRIYYTRYFERKEKWGYSQMIRRQSDVSPYIILDLLEDSDKDYITLADMSRNDVIDFMKKYKRVLSEECFRSLACMYRIHGKEFMSGSDKNKVLKTLSELTVAPKRIAFKIQ